MSAAVKEIPSEDVPSEDALVESNSQNENPSEAKAQTQKSTLRAGRWFPEEERYAARLITEFKAGTLPLQDITLREFLSLIFHCHPMRITKKFEGNNMIGKITYKRRGELTTMEWWELKELERKFWERMVKSRSPTALEAHARMVEYSNHVFQGAPDLSEFMSEKQQEAVSFDIDKAQSMLVQLQQMLKPVVGDTSNLQQNREADMTNIHTINMLLRQLNKKQMDLISMSEIPDLPSNMKSLVESAKFCVQIDIDALETMLYKSNEVTNNKSFSMATANMLKLREMVQDSKYKLFLMEYKFCRLSELIGAHHSIKALADSIETAKRDVTDLEDQLLNMKSEINQKYKQES